MLPRNGTGIAITGLLFAGSLGVGTGSAPAAVNATSDPPPSAYAVIKTIGVGTTPISVAVNNADDSVYVTNFFANMSVIQGVTGAVDGSIPAGAAGLSLAVDQDDDTVYVTDGFSNLLQVVDGALGIRTQTLSTGLAPVGVAVNSADDTVYVANYQGASLSVLSGRNLDDSVRVSVDNSPSYIAVDQTDDTVYITHTDLDIVTIMSGSSLDDSTTVSVDDSPGYVAVNQVDDTVYVANEGSNTVSVIAGRDGTVNSTIPVGNGPFALAVRNVDGAVFVTSGNNLVTVINGRQTDDSVSVLVGNEPEGIAVSQSSGLAYVSNINSGTVSVIGMATPSLQTTSGLVGSTARITLTVSSLPATYLFDDSTILGVTFGGVAGSGLGRVPGTNTWVVAVPAGASTVPVSVALQGGLTASAGSFTYADPPPPTPPGAPTDVSGTAGDGEVALTWNAPTSTGSFPVSTYQVRSIPEAGVCLAAQTACTVSGLVNGVAYSFEARALTGAGWGPWSQPSKLITPVAPAIVISGSRGEVRGRPGILVTGETSGFDVGAILRPWIRFPGQSSYVQGKAGIPVGAEGEFTWQRRTGKTIYVSIRSELGDVRSNRVIIRAL